MANAQDVKLLADRLVSSFQAGPSQPTACLLETLLYQCRGGGVAPGVARGFSSGAMRSRLAVKPCMGDSGWRQLDSVSWGIVEGKDVLRNWVF